jgi:xanthine dehydrogenase YagS FAD-binding subunit
MNGKLTSHYDVRTLDEASHLLQTYEAERAKVIGGGIDILRLIKQKYTPEIPAVLVNIKTIPELSYIKEENKTLKIGALTRLSDIESSKLIKANYGILAEAASMVGSPQVRNMATIAGNICQDINCWYYRAPQNYFYCLYKGGASCPAKEGDNRWMFSIFGTPKGIKCYGTCQSDMAIALSALGALVKTTQRTIPINQFFAPTRPGNVLGSNEVIGEIQIPAFSPRTRAKYLKFSIRKSWDHPLVSVACLANDEQAKIVIGSAFITPYVATEAEEIIKGEKIGEGLAEKAGEIAVKSATPMSMNAWKVQVTKILVKRTLLSLTG